MHDRKYEIVPAIEGRMVILYLTQGKSRCFDS